jgi:hypothetical protein
VTQRRSKYGTPLSKRDKPTAFGHTFDSIGERARYLFLRGAEQDGLIRDLEVHPRFDLLPMQRSGGRTWRKAAVTFDFAYTVAATGEGVVEDFKSRATMTQAFMLRAKLFLYRYPRFTLRVVTSPTEDSWLREMMRWLR